MLEAIPLEAGTMYESAGYKVIVAESCTQTTIQYAYGSNQNRNKTKFIYK